MVSWKRRGGGEQELADKPFSVVITGIYALEFIK
jgi:hypothetical protein